MELSKVTQEELQELSEIDSYGKWLKIERYQPEARYIPEATVTKTANIPLPLRSQPPVPPSRRLYHVTSADGKTLLIKTDDISRFDRECEIAEFADRTFKNDVYVSYPVEVGPYANESRVYSIYVFFNGDNLARMLPTLYMTQQLELGVDAGKMLKKFHSVKPTAQAVPRKPKEDIFLLLTKLEEKGIDYTGFKEAAEFMKKNFDITDGRPVNALHGDFSANTLFIDKRLNVGMFPLEDPHWGDPIKDLIFLQESYNRPFMKGVLKGWLDGTPPSDFFTLLAYYSTERALSDINTAVTEEEKAIALIRAQKLADDLNNYQVVIPSWY